MFLVYRVFTVITPDFEYCACLGTLELFPSSPLFQELFLTLVSLFLLCNGWILIQKRGAKLSMSQESHEPSWSCKGNYLESAERCLTLYATLFGRMIVGRRESRDCPYRA